MSTAVVFLITYLYFLHIKLLTFLSYIPLTFTEYSFLDFYRIPIFSNFFLKFYLDGFGLVLLNLAYMVGVISLLALDTRFYWKNMRFVFLCNIIVLFILFFVISNDIITFFLLYECLIVPSFFLVYAVSPTRRSIQASLYFIIWTQLGSLLVLLGSVYMFYITNSWYFDDIKNFNFTITEIYLLYAFFFFGFGFKIPVWPFHHWLTKTHVEAPAGFSIFLSGFLVKSAVYGFYKLSNLLGGEIDTTFFSIFAFLGALDASFKMWGQTDLKKLVAFGTIQEMSLIYLVLTWGDTFAIYSSLIFCITHAFLSAILFYLVDCIQRRYRTRNITEVEGILHITPNLGIVILLVCLVYAGLPGTMKFITEFYVFSGLIEAAPYSVIILLFGVNYIGIIGFCKPWYNAVFGLTADDEENIPMDLTFKDFFIITICFICFFFLVL